jgi:hypothetical protein
MDLLCLATAAAAAVAAASHTNHSHCVIIITISPILMVKAIEQRKFLELYILFPVLGWLSANFIW